MLPDMPQYAYIIHIYTVLRSSTLSPRVVSLPSPAINSLQQMVISNMKNTALVEVSKSYDITQFCGPTPANHSTGL